MKEREILKKIVIGIVFAMLMSSLLLMPAAFAQPPTIKRPDELIIATIEGGMPETVDPAWCYDTASATLIFNVYDVLLIFDGESMDYYLPSAATEWTIENIEGTTSPEGLDWTYRYTFTIREDMPFQGGDWGPEGTYMVTPETIEYSIERGMVQDRDGGPQWMLYEPLLNTWGAAGLGDIGNATIPGPDVALVGEMIDHSVESNDTHVWFNIAFPGAYAPFLQILSQSWSSILSKGWINDYVIGTLGRPDWNGEWGDYTDWVNYHNPEVSPLDDPDMIMCGSGPYQLETYSSAEEYWSIVRFGGSGYWKGWPADYPAPPYPSTPTAVKSAGYLERIVETWHFVWETRRDMFLAGDVDLCAVPRQYMSQVLGQPGVRCIYPLPALSNGALFFTFDIDPLTPYGTINDPGVFTADGIPSDFFGNPDWGINVRKAFAHSMDYDTLLATALAGEASRPATAHIEGLSFYDAVADVPRYEFDLAQAETEFRAVPGLWDTGFTAAVLYNTGNLVRETAANLLKDAIESLNPNFHCEVSGVPWGTAYLPAMVRSQLSCFIIGWLADYPDPHNFVYPFYYTYGTFSHWQGYSNADMDVLIDEGIAEGDPEGRAAIYHDIAVFAVEDCPSVNLYQPVGRHFERDWVCGWYYNPIYPGTFAYNLWKWYYVPHSLSSVVNEHPIANYVPCDVDYSGRVDIIDISLVAKAFGSSFGPPMHARWIFRCDIDNNRKVNIIDIAAVAKYFRQTSSTWSP